MGHQNPQNFIWKILLDHKGLKNDNFDFSRKSDFYIFVILSVMLERLSETFFWWGGWLKILATMFGG